ncbi:kinase-like domain-containing protein [Rhizophagus diaphanus]|nr:kinase-like domain-containing protein [Rhizophagus diaphanus] [Rhizophagus sp. MUCL 43196]
MNSVCVIQCFGITKDPKTNNYMMVMEYAENGSLRRYLDKNYNSLNWKEKLNILYKIASGLLYIHYKGLIHRDFHCGNILSNSDDTIRIADLGLCRPANIKNSQNNDNKIYGVLPYVAPEVLRGQEYTQESDIYGFGIIANEICTGLPPYHDIAHDEFLAMRICRGLRPKSNHKIPKLIFDIINQCWNGDPSKRPKAKELPKLLEDLIGRSEINNECLSLISTISPATSIFSYTKHPHAIYTTRIIKYSVYSEYSEYSASLKIDFANWT